MDNFYNYFFYIVATTYKKLNKYNELYSFSSTVFISVCFGINVMTIFFIVEKFNKIVILNTSYSLLIGLASLLIHCFYFLWKGKGKKIIVFYDEMYENKKFNPWSIAIIIVYIVATFGLCVYATR